MLKRQQHFSLGLCLRGSSAHSLPQIHLAIGRTQPGCLRVQHLSSAAQRQPHGPQQIRLSQLRLHLHCLFNELFVGDTDTNRWLQRGHGGEGLRFDDCLQFFNNSQSQLDSLFFSGFKDFSSHCLHKSFNFCKFQVNLYIFRLCLFNIVLFEFPS